MPKATVKLIVTGDDFGYCPRRNQGIVECFLAGAISNVSLLVNGSAVSDAVQLAKSGQYCFGLVFTSMGNDGKHAESIDYHFRPFLYHKIRSLRTQFNTIDMLRDAAERKKRNRAKTQPYSIPLGLHANLSEGSPVCPSLKETSSLLSAKGFFHGKIGIRTALAEGLLNTSEVKQELTAQVELFHELTGHLPHHMDGHQHVHVLPEIRHIFAHVLKDYGIAYTRIPIEPDLPRCDWIDPPLMAFYQGVEKDSLNTVDVFRKHGIRWPDIYIGLSTMGKNMSVTNVRGAIDNATAAYLAKEDDSSTLPSSSVSPDQETRTVTIELMTHPGYPSIPPVGGCGEGPDDFSQSWERQHELETLKNIELQNHYKTRNIELCAFKDLRL